MSFKSLFVILVLEQRQNRMWKVLKSFSSSRRREYIEETITQ